MIPAVPRPLLVTHGGKFHCDEVFAYAVLRLALGVSRPGEDHTLLRTREAALIEQGDIVWDVGSRYDPAANRFDHHQRGAPLRPDETPFSAAGLVWQIYGQRAVAALLAEKHAEAFAPAIAAELDEKLIRRIDEIDTGVSLAGPVSRDSLNLAALLGDFNPAWDSEAAQGPSAGDAAFQQAAGMAGQVLANRVEAARAKHQAEAGVLAAFAAAEDKRVLVLETGMPWKTAVFRHDLPVIFCVSPASNGNWMVDTMPPEPGSFAQRVPLPAAWAGLETAALAQASGIEDAVFVHLRCFVGAAKSREGATEMARQALNLAAEPG